MATLQKFKLLATQCGVAPSPTRSPRTSPLVQFRRRKTTLRMLLSRNSSRCRSPPRRHEFSNQPTTIVIGDLAEKKSNKELPGRTLKDLFVLTPSLESEAENTTTSKIGLNSEGSFATKISGDFFGGLKDDLGSPRPAWVGFRHRSLLRRAWHPMLVSIPE